ncbi:unnamed protein product [Euphydryas editha]|uniref:Peptidase aspartic putative domain-containing protein n=1 Tax=Euphydryas editha TaxID=104508 RepID=A0AAU9UNN4_EUPED|nr:unnamed protein product [Euphydryas editha]
MIRAMTLQKSCTVHQLQLCVRTLLDCDEEIKTVLSKYKKISTRFNYSPIAVNELHQIQKEQLNQECLSVIQECNTRFNGQVLLPTTLIEVSNPITNKTTRVRALLDCGSQSSFTTRSLIKKLSLNTNSIDAISAVGIGDNALNNVIETCTLKLSSINCSYNLKLTCMVLDKIMGDISKSRINLKNLNLPQNLPLADLQFYSPGSIDLLIGSDKFWDIIFKLGILVTCNLALTKLSPNDIDVSILPKFWEIEDLPKRPFLSWSEEACEKHFVENTYRLKSASLTGEAEQLLQNFCLSDANYQDAWQKLVDRFDNQRVIVNNIFNRLLNQKKMTTESTQGIKDLLDTTTQCLDSIKNIGIGVSNWDAIIAHITVRKIDSESHKLWEQSLKNSTDILTFLPPINFVFLRPHF